MTSGLVVVDKPAGWTSHQVVGRIRRLAGTRKVGHAGTLDPMATGVLLVGVDRATRLLGHLMLTEKEYTATIRLGIGTHTDDAEGEVVAGPGFSGTAGQVRGAMAPLTGDIDQVPTAVSAIKVDGRRAYARVRAGENVELAARPVTVRAFELGETRPVAVDGVDCLDCDVRVVCSSGTYIRALARDLGAALGSAGHLTALRRTRVGPFTLAQARVVDNDTETIDILGIDAVAASVFTICTLDEDDENHVRHGRRLSGFDLPAPTSAMMDRRGRFLALYKQSGTDAVAEAVFVSGSGDQ